MEQHFASAKKKGISRIYKELSQFNDKRTTQLTDCPSLGRGHLYQLHIQGEAQGREGGSCAIITEQTTYSSWTHTNKHLQKLRSTNSDERDVGFSSCGLSEQRLPGAWRASENGTLQI